MQLSMNPSLADCYKSRSQCARVVTEDWAARNLYCPACTSNKLVQAPNNARAIDFNCSRCSAVYQLKSGRGWSERRIPDAGYEAMIRAIRSDNVPNLLVMQYSVTWNVRNLLLVPSFFFAETAIERRAPLGPTARRAGWVGCNILRSVISPEGKLRLVTDETIEDRKSVRALYKKIKPIEDAKGRVAKTGLSSTSDDRGKHSIACIHYFIKAKDIYAINWRAATFKRFWINRCLLRDFLSYERS